MKTLHDLRNISIKEAVEHGINKVAVYGTLRKGNNAHRMVEQLSFEGKSNLTCGKYQMFNAGAFPYILDLDEMGLDDGHPLREIPQIGPVIEVYSIPDDNLEDTLRRLDMYEGFPDLYNRDVIECPDVGKFFLYTYADTNDGDIMGRFIGCNDWNRYIGMDDEQPKKERKVRTVPNYAGARARRIAEEIRQHDLERRNIRPQDDEPRRVRLVPFDPEELMEDDPREDR